MLQDLGHVSQTIAQHLSKGNYHVRQVILHKYTKIRTYLSPHCVPDVPKRHKLKGAFIS